MSPYALVPLVTLLVVIAGAAAAARRWRDQAWSPRRGDVGWLAAVGALLAVVAGLCAAGLYTGGLPELVALCAAALVAAALVVTRRRVLLALQGRLGEGRHEAICAAVVLLACCALGFLAMELPYNYEIPSMALNGVAIEAVLILLFLCVLYFVFQRHGAGVALGVGACALIGIAQFFVASFKASAILPNDLFVLGTAAAVSNGYVYSVDGDVLLGLSCVLLAMGLCSLVLPAQGGRLSSAARACANLACAALAACALWAGVTVPSYFDDLGVEMKYWYSLDYYRKQGFLTTFIAVAQDLPIEAPEGYTAEEAQEIEDELAEEYDETLGSEETRTAAEEQFDEVQPTVICIMNETFADLSLLDGESWGYDGPEYYQSLDDTLVGGVLSVSVLGGGTCNTEFEFLTGVSLAFVGDGKYPYSLYDLSDAPSLAKQFSELGYTTTAIHPNYATNWNRDLVYEALGFDTFLTIDDFEGAETYHSGVSDAETYAKILELLEEDDDPQFIFNVTMQNHSGYDQDNIGDVEQYSVDGVSDYDNGRLSEYLACIEESDRALEEFMAALEELDRPVVLLFFGDHQPALSSIVNDAIWSDETDEMAHNLRVYETTYFIWANYDVAGNDQVAEQEQTSPAYLAAMLCELMGAPLTDFQKAQLVTRESVPALSLVGWMDSGGTWHELEGAALESEAYRKLAFVTYLEFASKLE